MRDKVLYLSAFSPFSTIGGGNQRCTNLLGVLCKRYDVDVVVDFDDVQYIAPQYLDHARLLRIKDRPVSKATRLWRKIKVNTGLSPCEKLLMPSCLGRLKAMHKLLRTTNYKYVVVRYLFMIPYYRLYHVKNLIIDIDDLPAEKAKTTLLFNKKALSRWDKIRISHLDHLTQKLTRQALLTFSPNPKDTDLIPNCHYLPNVPIPDQREIRRHPSHRIIFIGSMSQDMNYTGVDHFITSIWPNLLSRHKTLEFHIIGKGTPSSYIKKWNKVPGVVLRGFVDDVFEEYMQASLAIAPIYTGAGTNIKVLEALMYQVPCVVTRFAYRGFESALRPGKDIVVTDSDVDFETAINRLLSDNKMATEISLNGQQAVNREFGMEKLSSCFYSAVDELENAHKSQ